MKYYSKRLIIWRFQVQALDGPPINSYKSMTYGSFYLFLQVLDYGENRLKPALNCKMLVYCCSQIFEIKC